MFVPVCLCASVCLCVMPPAEKKEGSFPHMCEMTAVDDNTHAHTPHVQYFHQHTSVRFQTQTNTCTYAHTSHTGTHIQIESDITVSRTRLRQTLQSGK